ncbi:MAG: hypothetical protein JXA82_04650 [Sedimentisphaerales bacterium]|nr:hypothetical protein [Sedimentisphaerales bacterium]
MKSTIFSMALAVMIAGSALAVVTVEDDLNPAPFRGEAGTTYQAWSFSTDANPAYADEAINEYGTPVVEMIGNFQETNTVWLDTDLGQQGVWIVDRGSLTGFEGTSDMRIYIPNVPVENPLKEIWVQLVYYAQEGGTPNVYVIPEGNFDISPVPHMELVEKVEDGEYYYHATFSIQLTEEDGGNPDWEYIYIRPRDCQVYIDSVIVETQCIPEPLSLTLLGLGGLFLRRRG